MRGTFTASDILEKLERPGEPPPVSEIFEDIRHVFGVEHVVYHALNVRGLTKDGHFLRLTYSDDWISRYFAEDYFKVDPVVEEGTRAFMPFSWTDLDWSARRRREFSEDATGHSVGISGMSVPIRGPDGQHALFSVSASENPQEWDKLMQSEKHDLHLIAHHVHHAMIKAESAGAPIEIVKLSTRERDVLQWAAVGKTTDETASILGIAERTVRVYLDTARHKLNAGNRTHAVARALCLGLIHPPG